MCERGQALSGGRTIPPRFCGAPGADGSKEKRGLTGKVSPLLICEEVSAIYKPAHASMEYPAITTGIVTTQRIVLRQTSRTARL